MMGESRMVKETQKMEQKVMYPVHCTECGKRIGNKFFPLDKLLGQYNAGADIGIDTNALMEFLGIGALYGQTVLPNVPPLVDQDGNWNFEKPKSFAGQTLPEFTCADNEIPENELRPVNLNIASILAQFCLITGFEDIYPMLALRQKMDEAAADDLMTAATVSEEDQEKWQDYCNKIYHIPGVTVDPLLTIDERKQAIGEFLSNILRLAEKEAKAPGKQHFAAQELKIGWRYKKENDRQMPYALVVRGSLIGIFDATECCCDKCRKPLSWEMGAYEQKVIGILGTQAVGKTTYLMALADTVPQVKFEKMTVTPATGDPQWDRVKKENGLLWKYQHGFAPEKTAVKEGAAPALTFVVKKDKDSEPIMYTLADIPGEVFYDEVNQDYLQTLIDAIKKLLVASDALILVVNSEQLRKQTPEGASDGNPETGGSKLVVDSANILNAFKKYLPEKQISTAVVLTAADKLGDLRSLLGLAYDIRKLQPLVGGNVYNTEVMHTASRAVGKYMDSSFNQFMHNLKDRFVPKGSEVAAFAVSSGTQYAAQSDENSDEAKEKVRRARFGIEAPLLWLLSCDGLLEQGRADEHFTHYDEERRQRIRKEMTREEP